MFVHEKLGYFEYDLDIGDEYYQYDFRKFRVRSRNCGYYFGSRCDNKYDVPCHSRKCMFVDKKNSFLSSQLLLNRAKRTGCVFDK